ncbi:MAG: ABC transporter permease [Epulopiscium sp. Nuni2H_MBin003]|nr:MAG: ABC transporter permease [Epulopiscium sp. Nuni2H_MBin003]
MEKENKVLPYLMMLPSILLMSLVVIYPIIMGVITSFQQQESGGYGFENYRYFFENDYHTTGIWYTLKIVVITVVAAIAISYLLAIFLRFSNTPISRLMGKLYILPRFIPALVAVNGMITVIRDSGLINRISQVFGYNLHLNMMYDEKGIILMNLWFNIPFATMMISAALSAINDSEVEAMRDVSASKTMIFTNLILPLTYRDVFVAATFIFMSNISSFTTPYLMGATYPKMMGVTLFDLYNNFHYGRAAALSVIMFLFSSVAASIYIYINMRKDKWEVGR